MEVYQRPKEPNTFGIRISERQFPAFLERLKAEGCSRNKLINKAIAKYLAEEEVAENSIEKAQAA